MKKPEPPRRAGGPTASDYARGAHPLSPRVARVPPPERAAPLRRVRQAAAFEESAPPFETSDDGMTLEGARAGQGRRLVRELRRGDLPVLDTLDLHGLTVGEAEAAVRHFCSATRGADARAVLIVHGRGTHSPQGRGVLRDQMAAWLITVPVAHDVLCFVTARPQHGGSGALYVLLAPQRGRPMPRTTRRGGGRAAPG